MGNSAFGWTNIVKTASLSASNAEPALPASNLTIDQASTAQAWQTQSGVLSPSLTITPGARTAARCLAVFRTNLTATGTVQAGAYTNPGNVLVAASPLVPFVNGQAVCLFPSAMAADYFQLYFNDSANPDGHLNIPLVFCGPMWFPTTALTWDTTIGRDDVSDTVTSRGGQVYDNLRSTVRRLELALDSVRLNEAYAQLDVLDRTSRLGGNILVIPDATSVNMPYEATFGILKATADVSFGMKTITRRSWRARLTERL